jgi:uridine kinase
VTRAVAPLANRRIVAVDGLDGSGKSQVAAALVAACAVDGVTTTLFHVDDFRREVDFAGLDPATEAALYYERYYDLAALDRALAAFLAGGDAELAIVEGVLTLRVPAIAASASLVLLAVSADEARRRILERDRKKGRTDQEIQRRIARRYFPAQERYRAEQDPDARADAVVDNDDWRRPRLVRHTPGRFPPPIERWLSRLSAAG